MSSGLPQHTDVAVSRVCKARVKACVCPCKCGARRWRFDGPPRLEQLDRSSGNIASDPMTAASLDTADLDGSLSPLAPALDQRALGSRPAPPLPDGSTLVVELPPSLAQHAGGNNAKRLEPDLGGEGSSSDEKDVVHDAEPVNAKWCRGCQQSHSLDQFLPGRALHLRCQRYYEAILKQAKGISTECNDAFLELSQNNHSAFARLIRSFEKIKAESKRKRVKVDLEYLLRTNGDL